MLLDRPTYLKRLAEAVRRSPVVALLGPRQCGKTTLARLFSESQPAVWFDLESVPDRRRLENPERILESHDGLIVLDEVQVLPELFAAIRVLVDRNPGQRRFLLLGSAAPEIVRGVLETLAGRIEFVELHGFDMTEIGRRPIEQLWQRGGFPRSFLAKSEEDSRAWREGFVRTFLERDLPQLGVTVPAATMRRFWTMLAHFHGQIWNASELARSMAASDKTTRSYLDLLSGTFVIRQLQPWFENLRKRQVKAPKVYVRDSGLLHQLLTIETHADLLAHPRVGASWEGFVIEQVLRVVRPADAYFWATHAGAELDLMFFHRGRRYGIEVKLSEAPTVTRSMRVAISDLGLEQLWVIYPGNTRYQADDRIAVLPVAEIATLPSRLGLDAASPFR